MKAGPFIFLLAFLSSGGLRAAEVIPPVPPRHFNDFAGVVSPQAAQSLDEKLRKFEEESSTQILVVTYPRMQSDSSIEDYTVRVAQKWGVGGQKFDNGAVLFVFSGDRRMYIQVGYGLEGALPDALAKTIIENEIKPRFQRGDFDGGLTAAVDALIAASRGEYTASPRTEGLSPRALFLIILLLIVVLVVLHSARRGPIAYTRRGRYDGGWGPVIVGPRSGGWSGGGFGGGGISGGGGFSAGGGSFGGGGAGGSW